ncbi:CopD family protein [Salinirubellus sp. GCM10025818]|uniref:CopD family protein n=1 Tax=Salinirubellus TaxID=2162630 RepID=UPI003610F875
MVVLLGGSASAWNALRSDPDPGLLVRYEWLFWGTTGAMLVTGVGNLGALGAPGPATRWGTVLTVKLALVLVFVVGSAVRTLAVERLAREDGALAAARAPLRRLYAATTVALLAVVVLAEVLAHG